MLMVVLISIFDFCFCSLGVYLSEITELHLKEEEQK